ncbi:TonB-dependent receptor [Dasania sp. GY-MA-18]|uniref:TonB-dependent receptor n=1 Tax=Dasania phycosphaerae TaxID=2950436 RepID=A0A9J6RLP8_9GAMM|nr:MULTISPECIES: TonB-dependent receptor [Dasania]MCR8923214.1 TonB-dependent receptor [Dasania sp. GY-MA-18]MCZ0865646.1 TonB-dependent receptor [Dasania phycosphaerae]MCZ0869371.1 TonB-dependent receptor [Dasania phycosphaerae]
MTKNNNGKKLALAAAVSIGAQAAMMPMANALALEELIVSARKQAETAQDVPIAVTALSGKMMTDLGVNEAGDIALYTPNFTWHTEFGRASPQPYMRGIGTNNFAPINNGPIAIYQDGVFIGPNVAQGFATFDVERVEVLKGPQGTLYGRNSTGGLINFISVKPEIGQDTSGYINVELGSHDTKNVEGAVGFSLGDQFAARLSVLRATSDGPFDNINPASNGKAGQIDDLAARAQLLFDNNEGLTILTNYHYGKAEPDTAPFKQVGLVDPNGVGPAHPDYAYSQCANPGIGSGCTDAYHGFVEDNDIYKTQKADDFEHVDTEGVLVRVDYEINYDMSFYSASSYDEASLRRYDDTDDGPFGVENDFYADDFRWYSQELGIANQSDVSMWHVGTYYYNEKVKGAQMWTNPFWGTGEGNEHEVETTSYALFGQYDYDFNESWGATIGLRWSYEEKEVHKYNGFMPLIANMTNNEGDGPLFSLADARAAAGGIDESHGVVIGTPTAKDWDEITGRISVDYNTEDGHLIYASIARGFKGGDVNGAAFLDEYLPSDGAGGSLICPGAEAPGTSRCQSSVDAFNAKLEPVDPELLDAIEVGFKGDFMDGALRVNGAVFYYEYTDQQNTNLIPVAGTSANTTTLTNAGETKMPGIEIEVIATPTDAWYLQFNAGWVDAEYDEFVTAFGDNSGNQISLTPKTQFSGLVRYDFELDSGAIIALQTDVSWQSKTYFQPTNEDLLLEDSYALWGARVSYASADDRWTTALFAKNLTDKEYYGSGFQLEFLGSKQLKPGAPRYIGLSVDYKFGD